MGADDDTAVVSEDQCRSGAQGGNDGRQGLIWGDNWIMGVAMYDLCSA